MGNLAEFFMLTSNYGLVLGHFGRFINVNWHGR